MRGYESDYIAEETRNGNAEQQRDAAATLVKLSLLSRYRIGADTTYG
jgi:hypothetical protein